MFRVLQCKLFARYDWLVVVIGFEFASAPACEGSQYFKVNHSTSASCSRNIALKQELKLIILLRDSDLQFKARRFRHE